MKINHFDWSSVLLFVVICVCLLFVYITSAPVHAEPVAAALPARYIVKGSTRAGFYSQITAPGLKLTLKTIRHFNQVDGLRIETNPSYTVSGNSPAGAVALDVSLEDLVSHGGPIPIQTGQIVHVKGTLGARSLAVDIREQRKVDDLSGISVEVDTWKELTSADHQIFATQRRIVQINEVGGIRVERDSHYRFTGKDKETPFDLKIRESRNEDDEDSEEPGNQLLELSGPSTPAMTTLALALRPFLRP
jgi:hypothetical protein